MDITLFKNTSDPIYVVKTLTPVNPNPVPIDFIEDSNVVRPRLKLLPASNAMQANYAYIADWGRYYNITNHTVSNGYVYIDLKSDVLSSIAPQFRECEALVVRNQKRYNLYQTDDQFRIENRRALQRVEFPQGFEANVQEFLLCVIGNTEEEG